MILLKFLFLLSVTRDLFNKTLINNIMFAKFNEDESIDVVNDDGIQYKYYFENENDIEKIIKKCLNKKIVWKENEKLYKHRRFFIFEMEGFLHYMKSL